MTREQLSARLLVTFLTELEDQVGVLNTELLALETRPAEAQHLRAVFRVAHTLKGAARAAGVASVEQFCHTLEGMLAEARDGKRSLRPDDFSLLFAAADALADAGKRLKAGEVLPAPQLGALTARFKGLEAPPMPARSPTPSAVQPAAAAGKLGKGQVRVDSEKLDTLLAASGQLVIASRQAESRPAELVSFRDRLVRSSAEWQRTSRRLRVVLTDAEVPSSLVQAVDDLGESLLRLAHDSERIAAEVQEDGRLVVRATDEVTDQVRRLRLRPFSDACEALPRVVRDLVAETGKEIDLDIQGGSVRIDRSVSDGLREALLHLVRNAADHGIEAPAERLRKGKPSRGTIRVSASQGGERLRVAVSDDGGGLDLAGLRMRLAERSSEVPEDDAALVRTLFQGGLSSRLELTTISGRGVGLEVVRAAVERMRGSVNAGWTRDVGTAFTIECPVSLSTVRALLVNVGSQTLGIPTAAVERLVLIDVSEISRAEGRDAVPGPAGIVPLVRLSRLLPPLLGRPTTDRLLVVHLRAGEQRLAVAVDELVSEEEVMLRPLGPGLESLEHLSGAVILGSARVSLMLDPTSLVTAGLDLGSGPSLAETQPATTAKRRILVVDDSITTRTLEQSLLEAAGYEVSTAVDGADGWRVLQARGADLVVADVEMPRMDGFSMCEAIRASKRFKELPVVLVTALESPEHRARGLEAGADAYFGKSSFDQQRLLDTIQQLLG